MVRISIFSFALIAAASSQARGQEPWQFQWKAGQTLDYRVQHTTSVTEVVQGARVETHSRLDLVKRWKVVEVNAEGVATLELVLTSMRNEQTRPSGETLLFDSKNLDKSTPELREMNKFLGKPLAVLRLDRFGRTHEVKLGSAARYEAEPPFVLVLPGAAPKQGQAWLRPFNVTLEPPLGAGEKHSAQHRFTCKKIEGNQATVALATEFTKMPDAPQDQLPLLQKATEGEVVFDIGAGRMTRAQLNINKMVENHQGAGSSYHLVSGYTEELAP